MNLFYNLPIELQDYIKYLNPHNRVIKDSLIKRFDIEITDLYNTNFLFRRPSFFFKKYLKDIYINNEYNEKDYPLTCLKDFYGHIYKYNPNLI